MVSRMLASLGHAVYDADAAARSLYDRDESLLQLVVGSSALNYFAGQSSLREIVPPVSSTHYTRGIIWVVGLLVYLALEKQL